MPRKKPREPARGVSPEAWGTVHPVLDLHGLTGDEARRRAEEWLRGRQAENVRTVVVVTGRGLHSGGLPVVRSEIEHLLAGLKGTLVTRWSAENLGGSFRVELRRPPARAPRPAAPVPPLLREAQPALRLRAEEALAELGIASTPALLEAEIRRLLDEGED